jgi:serine/threonine protein kinase
MIGQIISHYKILEKLGEGGMGVVYKAEDLKLERIVALKFLKTEALGNAKGKWRFVREAQAAAALDHPNICTVHEIDEAEGRTFIVMAYVEGQNLQKKIESGPLQPDEALDIAIQAAEGLQAAHEKGITHRDIKPANIMMTTKGQVKLMDFGLAKLAGWTVLTKEGIIMGTAAYMSPEQVRGEELDHRSDIYSMGVVLYQLLTGELPFEEAYHLAVMYAIANEAPKPPRELNPAIPPQLEAVILKAMEKESAKRYQTAAEMEDDLLELQETLGSKNAGKKHSRRQGKKDQATIIEKIFPSRTKTALKYAIALFIITIGVAIWFFKSENSRTDDYEKSRREFARARVNAAMLYLKENQLGLAIKELESAVKSDPSYSLAWSSLAAANIRAQELDLAIYQSKKAIELDRKNSDAYYNLAYALEEKGELDAALESYTEAVKIDSTFTPAYSALGNLYIKLNKAQEAIQILNLAIRIAPESEHIYLIYKNLGKACFALEQYDKAIEFLEHSLQRQPKVSETIYFLAKAYEAAGMKPESIEQWKHYVEIESDTLKQREAVNHLQNLAK